MSSRARWVAGVALLVILAALAVTPSLRRARGAANEAGAMGSIREIIRAQVAYAMANGGYFDTLECLTKPAQCIPGYRGPAFLDREVQHTHGYTWVFHGGPAADPAPDQRTRISASSVQSYTVTAAVEGDELRRAFCGDATGRMAFTTPPATQRFAKSVDRGLRCLLAAEPGRESVQPPPLSRFEAGRLQETSVLATLDTPLRPGRSAVWCAALDIAWRRARTDVVKGPLLLARDPPSARRLNASSSSEDDLTPESVLAIAGLAGDVAERIRREMAQRFPHAQPPELRGGAFVAFAYLFVNVPFKLLYQENDKELPFIDAAGRAVPVRSFGLQEKDRGLLMDLREQAQVLFSASSRPDAPEFAIDPDRFSAPYQVVLARIERPPSLAAGLDRVNRLSAGVRPHALQMEDLFLVPNQHWELDHRFAELEAPLLNRGFEGLPLEVLEKVRFRLDRTGARLEAEATITALGGTPSGAAYVFDRPFLLLLRKRGADRPVFAMWVANAELLDKALAASARWARCSSARFCSRSLSDIKAVRLRAGGISTEPLLADLPGSQRGR